MPGFTHKWFVACMSTHMNLKVGFLKEALLTRDDVALIPLSSLSTNAHRCIASTRIAERSSLKMLGLTGGQRSIQDLIVLGRRLGFDLNGAHQSIDDCAGKIFLLAATTGLVGAWCRGALIVRADFRHNMLERLCLYAILLWVLGIGYSLWVCEKR